MGKQFRYVEGVSDNFLGKGWLVNLRRISAKKQEMDTFNCTKFIVDWKETHF